MTAPDLPATMTAVLLTGHGGTENLRIRHDVPVPSPAPDEVLIAVGAAGVNNTDVNTRLGWYSKSVTGPTDAAADSFADASADAAWNGAALGLPRIQGADCCGTIVAVGAEVAPARVGERVLVRSMHEPRGGEEFELVTLGSEFDGAFAQYCAVRSSEAYAIDSELSDVELASFPCAYSTAENLLERAQVTADDRVLITGASGGVGSAAVQLAALRGAHVTAIAAASKAEAVSALGADAVLPRDADVVTALGAGSVDVVIDLVAGPTWPRLLEVLRRGGRYATSGAIAGPIVELDVRTLYLHDLTLLGCTWQPRHVFENLVGYIAAGRLRPVVAGTYPLTDIVRAQEDFAAKGFVGKLVLVP